MSRIKHSLAGLMIVVGVLLNVRQALALNPHAVHGYTSPLSVGDLQNQTDDYNANNHGYQSVNTITNGNATAPSIGSFCINGDLNVKCYGARGGAQYQLAATGSITGTTFTRSDGGTFTTADVGKTVMAAAGGDIYGNAYQSTFAAFISATQMTVTAAPAANFSNKEWAYGWDDTAAIQACLTAAGNAGKDCFVPDDTYLITAPVYLGNPTGANVTLHNKVQIGTGTGATGSFTATLTAPVQRDSVFIWADQFSGSGGRQVWVDEDQSGTGTGQGVFLPGTNIGATYGTINYSTGALNITWSGFPTNGAKVWVTYYTRPAGGSPLQSNSQAGLHGSGSFAAYLILAPSVTAYGLWGPNESGKTWRGFNINSALSGQLAFGGMMVPYTNGAPSAQDHLQNITIRGVSAALDADLLNDSSIESVYAQNPSGTSALNFSIFGNGNGGQMWFNHVYTSAAFDTAGQNVGIKDSILTAGLRLESAESDNITIDNTQIYNDPYSLNGITTITGGCNASVASSLNLNNVWFAAAGATANGAIAGHWVNGGVVKNTSFAQPVFGVLDNDTCNHNQPLFTFYNSGNGAGQMNICTPPALVGAPACGTSIANLVHWKWCQDGVSGCIKNYDDLATTGTTFAGIGTPSPPQVTNGGTAGVTSYSYYQVDVGRNGLDSVPSAVSTTTTGNATLSTTNYNSICPALNTGAIRYKLLKTNTSTLLGTIDAGPYLSFSSGGARSTCLKDTGQATSAYTPQTVDQTGNTTISNLTQTPVPIASCPETTSATTGACNLRGASCRITDDSAACAFGTIVQNAGGGLTYCPAGCDGTNWRAGY